nr:hypothetical protein [Rhodopirellula bahusiensis]
MDDLFVAMKVTQCMGHTSDETNGLRGSDSVPVVITDTVEHRPKIETVNPRHDDVNRITVLMAFENLEDFVVASREPLKRADSVNAAGRSRQDMQCSHLFCTWVEDLKSPPSGRADFSDGKVRATADPKAFDNRKLRPSITDRAIRHRVNFLPRNDDVQMTECNAKYCQTPVAYTCRSQATLSRLQTWDSKESGMERQRVI